MVMELEHILPKKPKTNDKEKDREKERENKKHKEKQTDKEKEKPNEKEKENGNEKKANYNANESLGFLDDIDLGDMITVMIKAEKNSNNDNNKNSNDKNNDAEKEQNKKNDNNKNKTETCFMYFLHDYLVCTFLSCLVFYLVNSECVEQKLLVYKLGNFKIQSNVKCVCLI